MILATVGNSILIVRSSSNIYIYIYIYINKWGEENKMISAIPKTGKNNCGTDEWLVHQPFLINEQLFPNLPIQNQKQGR